MSREISIFEQFNSKGDSAMTQRFKCADVPLWLHDTSYYRNWIAVEPDREVEIPTECLRATADDVHSIEDLTHILQSIQFWGVEHIPQSVLEFCFIKDFVSWEAILGEGLQTLKIAFQHPLKFSLEVALKTNRPEFVTFWISKNSSASQHGGNAITHACRYGRLDLAQALRERGFKLTWDSGAYSAAAQYGHLHVLKYLHKVKCPLRVKSDTLVYAARGGQLECMKYLRFIGCPWDENITIEYAVSAHYQYLEKHIGKDANALWTDDFTIAPPANGYVECLRYARENGCPIHKQACNKTAQYGLLDCVQLLYRYGVQYEPDTFSAAASGGHIHCLQYLMENECPCNSDATAAAARHGHLTCLMYLHDVDCPWDKAATAAAVEGGHIECLKYLRDHGCPG